MECIDLFLKRTAHCHYSRNFVQTRNLYLFCSFNCAILFAPFLYFQMPIIFCQHHCTYRLNNKFCHWIHYRYDISWLQRPWRKRKRSWECSCFYQYGFGRCIMALRHICYANGWWGIIFIWPLTAWNLKLEIWEIWRNQIMVARTYQKKSFIWGRR